MTKTLTITLSDAQFEALQAAAAAARQSPETLAEAALAERLSDADVQSPNGTRGGTHGDDALLAIMRERGHLVDTSALPPDPGMADVPPIGTPERAQFEEELGNELSDALEQSGLSILDLIERR